ncbi:MAG: hypothetical protein K2W92_08395 [Alphaproteobacteria bacterium]|nr:hypothetical protein [Alphaproteobacteria bacterium]
MNTLLKSTALFLFMSFYAVGLQANIVDMENPEPSLRRFSHKTYNELKTVEEANNILHQSSQFPEFIEEAKNLAKFYEVSDFFGVRLAHKHTQLLPNTIMVDSYEQLNDQKVLVTRPTDKDSISEAVPASWILGKKGQSYKAFEYSRDPLVKRGFEILKTKPQLFEDFYNLTKKYNLENTLVPSILKRDWEDDLSSRGYTYYLEQSYENPSFMSIVSPQKENDFKELNAQPIITGWDLFRKPITSYVCTLTRYCADFGGTHNSNAHYHAVSNEL